MRNQAIIAMQIGKRPLTLNIKIELPMLNCKGTKKPMMKNPKYLSNQERKV